MKDVDWMISPNEIEFAHESFWIQIHNMPLGSMNSDKGTQVGKGIGEVIEFDSNNSGCSWGPFVRLKVRINIIEPFIRGRFLNLDDKILWLPVKYERLPSFCFHCGTIKHKQGGCPKLTRGNGDSYKCEYA